MAFALHSPKALTSLVPHVFLGSLMAGRAGRLMVMAGSGAAGVAMIAHTMWNDLQPPQQWDPPVRNGSIFSTCNDEVSAPWPLSSCVLLRPRYLNPIVYVRDP